MNRKHEMKKKKRKYVPYKSYKTTGDTMEEYNLFII